LRFCRYAPASPILIRKTQAISVRYGPFENFAFNRDIETTRDFIDGFHYTASDRASFQRCCPSILVKKKLIQHDHFYRFELAQSAATEFRLARIIVGIGILWAKGQKITTLGGCSTLMSLTLTIIVATLIKNHMPPLTGLTFIFLRFSQCSRFASLLQFTLQDRLWAELLTHLRCFGLSFYKVLRYP